MNIFGARRSALVALCSLAVLTGCVGDSDLGRDAFVGDWQCGEERVALSSREIITEAGTEKIAWIETAKNADFGLFTTKGGRYSIFDQTRGSLTLFSHESGTTRRCTRA